MNKKQQELYDLLVAGNYERATSKIHSVESSKDHGLRDVVEKVSKDGNTETTMQMLTALEKDYGHYRDSAYYNAGHHLPTLKAIDEKYGHIDHYDSSIFSTAVLQNNFELANYTLSLRSNEYTTKLIETSYATTFGAVQGNVPALEFMKSLGADLLKDHQKNLEISALNGHEEATLFLIDNGGDPEIAKAAAKDKGHDELVKTIDRKVFFERLQKTVPQKQNSVTRMRKI